MSSVVAIVGVVLTLRFHAHWAPTPIGATRQIVFLYFRLCWVAKVSRGFGHSACFARILQKIFLIKLFALLVQTDKDEMP